jgi:hypothetical protein
MLANHNYYSARELISHVFLIEKKKEIKAFVMGYVRGATLHPRNHAYQDSASTLLPA